MLAWSRPICPHADCFSPEGLASGLLKVCPAAEQHNFRLFTTKVGGFHAERQEIVLMRWVNFKGKLRWVPYIEKLSRFCEEEWSYGQYPSPSVLLSDFQASRWLWNHALNQRFPFCGIRDQEALRSVVRFNSIQPEGWPALLALLENLPPLALWEPKWSLPWRREIGSETSLEQDLRAALLEKERTLFVRHTTSNYNYVMLRKLPPHLNNAVGGSAESLWETYFPNSKTHVVYHEIDDLMDEIFKHRRRWPARALRLALGRKRLPADIGRDIFLNPAL